MALKTVNDLYASIVSKCPKCSGTGYQVTRGECSGQFDDCICMNTFSEYKTYLLAGIPERFWGFDLDHFRDDFYDKNSINIGSYLTWSDELGHDALRGSGILLWSGDHGTAKSAMASLVAKEGLKRGLRVHWFSGTALYDLLLQDSSFEESRVLKEIDKSELIIIDEVDKIFIPVGERKLVRARLSEFFNRIYEQLVIVIATSNCPIDDLQDYPSDIVDRMYEWDALKLVGVDYRKQQSRLQQLCKAHAKKD